MVSGGMKPGIGGLLDSVDLYHVNEDVWSVAPPLNRKRLSHSSCCISNFVYVSCGQDDQRSFNNIIESLDVGAFLANGAFKIKWELIEINFDKSCNGVRLNSLMVPLNDTEILILGGYSTNKSKKLCDGFIFDIQ